VNLARSSVSNGIRHTIQTFKFDQVNEYIEVLRAGEIVGGAG